MRTKFSQSEEKRSTATGFTLVETFVAMTVLLVAIVAPMTIASRGLQSSFFAKEQVTAFYLGQEAMEFIRKERDENLLTGGSWLAGLEAGTGGICDVGHTEGCGMDIRTENLRDCTGVDTCKLRYDDSSLDGNRGFYQYSTGELTPFTRKMWINEITPDQEAEIVVEVTWESGLFSGTRSITLRSRIFNNLPS